MEKPADNAYPIHELIRQRWSPRSFSDRPLELSALHSLLEAARWAPSCFNEQPWRFVVARREDREDFGRLLETLAPANQSWAKDAAVLMVAAAHTSFARNGKSNAHARHDLGLAVSQMVLQATHLGLAVHQMAGFDADMARRLCEFPEDVEPVTAVAIGHPADWQGLPEDVREREQAPRTRKNQAELAFYGVFGRPIPAPEDLA